MNKPNSFLCLIHDSHTKQIGCRLIFNFFIHLFCSANNFLRPDGTTRKFVPQDRTQHVHIIQQADQINPMNGQEVFAKGRCPFYFGRAGEREWGVSLAPRGGRWELLN